MSDEELEQRIRGLEDIINQNKNLIDEIPVIRKQMATLEVELSVIGTLKETIKGLNIQFAQLNADFIAFKARVSGMGAIAILGIPLLTAISLKLIGILKP